MLVCDARAEYGLNLQGGRKAIVHVDLPFSPNRIEQTTGTSRSLRQRRSHSLVRSHLQRCNAGATWASCVIDGFDVMERSIASLQYLVDAQMDALQRDLASEGVEAIVSLTSRLGGEHGEISKELRRIDQQDELEALQSDEVEGFDELLDADSDWRRVRDAVEPWLQRGLQFVRQVQTDETKAIDDIVRYHHGGFDGRGTLIPSGQFRADFLGAIDTEVRHANAEHPTTYRYAYRRLTSVSRTTRLVRSGDALFGGLLEFANTDDRGRFDAVWRCRPDYSPQLGQVDLFFRFDVLVEANLDEAMRLFPDDTFASARRRALGRRLDLVLAPEYITVWIDRGLEDVNPQIVSRWLESTDTLAHAGDKDLDRVDWQRVRKGGATDALMAWPDLVERAANAAKSSVARSTSRQQRRTTAATRLATQDAANLARLESRLTTLHDRERIFEEGRLAFERELGRALQQGVREPRLRLDAVGVLFLSNEPLSHPYELRDLAVGARPLADRTFRGPRMVTSFLAVSLVFFRRLDMERLTYCLCSGKPWLASRLVQAVVPRSGCPLWRLGHPRRHMAIMAFGSSKMPSIRLS